MNDTSPEVFRDYCRRLAALTPERRSEMGFDRSEFTRRLIRESVAGFPEADRKREFFNRLYPELRMTAEEWERRMAEATGNSFRNE